MEWIHCSMILLHLCNLVVPLRPHVCDIIDSFLLCRLQDISSGYWVLVLHFTRREAVRQIDELQHIATNLGRSETSLSKTSHALTMFSWVKYTFFIQWVTYRVRNSSLSCVGRAWLYLALSESSLESYLRLFQENQALLHKYYFK